MSERQRQIHFLKTLICDHHSKECRDIREQIQRAEREERVLRRMIFLVLVLALLALAGLSYATVFWPQPTEPPTRLLVRISCWLGLGSLISLAVFTGYWLWHRVVLNELYNQCRRLVLGVIRTSAPGK